LGDIQCFTLGKTGDNVHQDNIGVATLNEPLGTGGTDTSGANDANLGWYL
jgi:hypothetical protein